MQYIQYTYVLPCDAVVQAFVMGLPPPFSEEAALSSMNLLSLSLHHYATAATASSTPGAGAGGDGAMVSAVLLGGVWGGWEYKPGEAGGQGGTGPWCQRCCWAACVGAGSTGLVRQGGWGGRVLAR